MSLYHAYRPQTFGAIVGQEHVKRTLQNAVASGAVAHAYLFSGSRGVGKTSIARILAMAVNCAERQPVASGKGKKAEGSFEPCGNCQSCTEIRRGANLSVVEIDAASNRGIDEIRALREAVGFAPGKGLRKVYIIDEVHMLTKEAFNALLKTLEEPPAHALFILATTESHRVPETIISRTQHFEFKRASLADTRAHLERIAKEEQLQLDPEAIELLALHADGAFRDALSLLDQLQALGEKTITAEHVRMLLGIAPEAELIDLLTASFAGDAASVHANLARFVDRGYDPSALADALITTLRHALWAHYGIVGEGSESVATFAAEAKGRPAADTVSRIESLITAKQQLRWSPLPMLPIELALLPVTSAPSAKAEVTLTKAVATTSTSVTTSPRPVPAAPQPAEPTKTVEVVTEKASVTVAAAVPPQQETATVPPAASAPASLDDLPGLWTKIVQRVRAQNASLAALLRSSKLEALSQGECTVEVPFSFYADRIKDHKNGTILVEAIQAETSFTCTIRCALAGTTRPAPAATPASTETTSPRSQEDVANDVLEVFGAAAPQAEPVGANG